MKIKTHKGDFFSFFFRYEMKKRKKRRAQTNILPQYVLKRPIKIISNGETIFDNKGGKKAVPNNIQYTIKCYGYPSNINSNKKTPLIYNIKSETSFPIDIKDFV